MQVNRFLSPSILQGIVQGRHVVLPKSELSLELGSLLCELDISIVDRLTALLDPQPLFMNHGSNIQSRMFRSCNPSIVVSLFIFIAIHDLRIKGAGVESSDPLLYGSLT